MDDKVRIGVIGGSGIYQMDALTDRQAIEQSTPFGAPSDAYVVGRMHGRAVAFLARHGRGHTISPTRLNHRANVYGFKQLGVEYLISANACGSLRPELKPGLIVVPDQIYDHTKLRALSFFDDPDVGTQGIVAHIPFAQPFCAYLSRLCVQALQDTGSEVVAGGNFLTIEGPRFSSQFETRVFMHWGADIIGMTTSPEAQLAREAEMSYAVMAHVTDQDTLDEAEPVSVEVVVQNLRANAAKIKAAVARAVALLADAPPSPYAAALADALQTDRAHLDPQQIALLPELLGRLAPAP